MQVAEISRVLRPGGVFVASTILNPSSGIGSIVGDDTIRPIKQVRIVLHIVVQQPASFWVRILLPQGFTHIHRG